MFDISTPRFTGSGLDETALAGRPEPVRGSGGLSGDILLCVLDEIDYGVILIDARLRICHANHLARYELSTRRALCSTAHTLRAALPAQDEQLVKAVRSAQDGHRTMVDLGEGPCHLPVAVVPLKRPLEGGSGGAGEILIVCGKRQSCETLSLQFYARSRKLSAGEAAVLQGLCNGLRADDIARQNGVCVSTVRTQIASLRQKTGAASIRELVKRVASLPPLVPALRVTTLQ